MSDTWQAMCHIAWQGPMNVGHMARDVCGTWQGMCVAHGKACVWHMARHVCGTWHAMCVTHDMPCV